MKKNTRLSAFCLFLAAFIWGVAFVAQTSGMDYVDPLTFIGVRFALGATSLIPVVLIFEKGEGIKEKNKKTLVAGIIAGVVLFIAAALQQYGIKITMSAGRAGFITGLYIVIVPVFGIFLGRKATIFTWIGAVAACTGLYLLSVREGFSSVGLGDIALIICAFFWAAHILAIDRFVESVNPLRFAMTQFYTCSLLGLVGAFVFEDINMAGIIAGRIPIFYAGFFSSGIAYTLQIVGQRHVEPSRAALIFSMESLFSALGAAVILGELMDGRGYVGCALIFAGIIISQLGVNKGELYEYN